MFAIPKSAIAIVGLIDLATLCPLRAFGVLDRVLDDLVVASVTIGFHKTQNPQTRLIVFVQRVGFVDTAIGLDKGKKFDTPTLVEIWRMAPYLYDGRATTIEEVLTKFNPDDKHGVTSNLTEKEIKDLAQFVLSQ